MDKLQQRLNSAEKALRSFHQLVIIEHPNDVERDAAIQRFEFTFEACWKAGKQYLYDIEGVDLASPKSVFRSCRENNLLTDEETVVALTMASDRNLTVHTYNEGVANKIHSNLKTYFGILFKLVERMQNNLNGKDEILIWIMPSLVYDR